MAEWGFDKIKQNIAQSKRVLPVKLAKQAENHFTESFSKGHLDEHKWEEVQRRIVGTKAYKYPKKKGLSRRRNPILVMTGNLRRKVARSISDARWDKVRLVVDLPYAEIHNEGGGNMPQRAFMKQTKNLENMQKKLITSEMDKIWK